MFNGKNIKFVSELTPRRRGRFGRTIGGVLFGALVFSGCASGNDDSGDKGSSEPVDVGVTLPEPLEAKGKLSVGVRCDYPGKGYIDENGENAGFGPEIARKLASYAFGNSEAVELTCVTAENRVSQLTSNRVDMLIAALGWSEKRAEVINFSDSYTASVGKILTKSDLADEDTEGFLKNKTVLAVSGTPYSDYINECVPGAKAKNYKSLSDAVSDLQNDRGVAMVHDDASILELANKNEKLKVNGPDLDIGFRTSVGIRKDDADIEEWVNASLQHMQDEDAFFDLLNKTQSGPAKDAALEWIRRPDQNPDYSPLTGAAEC